MSVSDRNEGVRGFDFLRGSWRVANRRLRSRLAGSDDWEGFEASMENSPILGGLGNTDRYRAMRDGMGFEGFLLRLHDPETGRWSVYWADSIGCELGPPVVGGFNDGECELFGEDRHEGKAVLVRARYSEITRDSARWEQAFSEDGGGTWETNWIMQFVRETPSR
jgi:hypothetical protein